MHPDSVSLPSVRVLVLAGGAGTRFWPASTVERPKQLLPLGGPLPLVAATVERALPLAGPGGIRILAPAELMPALRGVLPGLPDSAFRPEALPRGTAPVLVQAAVEALAEDPEVVLVSLHADHRIEPPEAFRELVRGAVEVARRSRRLLTIGVPPDRPETGFGYLLPGAPLEPVPGGAPAREVVRFVEKPDAITAARYVEEGYRWNSGIFVWRADAFLEEVRRHAPELAGALPFLEGGDADAFFRAVPNLAVDHAVMELSDRVATVDATFRWDDVGSWEALARTREGDERGNVGVGPVHAVDCRDTVAWSEEGPLVLWGVKGLVAVRSGGVTLVMPRERASRLKELLEALPPEVVSP
jgi:mannose-1-phosphate guanylyltransferase